MKKHLFTIGLILGLNLAVFGQDLNNYKYVRVPEKFEFQEEENNYRLNELLAFLLEKEDFEALYKEPVPQGVSACEILTANLHNESGLFKSKVYISFSDCNDQTVFTSKEGVSRKKDFRDGFQEAVRKAFKSVEALQHQYSGVPQKTVVVKAVPSAEEKRPEDTVVDEKLPVFSSDGEYFILKPTAAGFALFEREEQQQRAQLAKSGRGDAYLFSSEEINGNAFFDTDGNLVVEYLKDGQLKTFIYELVQ